MSVPQSLSAVQGPGWQVEMLLPVEPGSLVPPSTVASLPLVAPAAAPVLGTVPVPRVGTGEPTEPPVPGSCAAVPPVPLIGQPTSAGQAGSVVPAIADAWQV